MRLCQHKTLSIGSSWISVQTGTRKGKKTDKSEAIVFAAVTVRACLVSLSASFMMPARISFNFNFYIIKNEHRRRSFFAVSATAIWSFLCSFSICTFLVHHGFLWDGQTQVKMVSSRGAKRRGDPFSWQKRKMNSKRRGLPRTVKVLAIGTKKISPQ